MQALKEVNQRVRGEPHLPISEIETALRHAVDSMALICVSVAALKGYKEGADTPVQKGKEYWALPPSLDDAHHNLTCHHFFMHPTPYASSGFSRIVFAPSPSAMSPLWPALLLTKGQADGLERPRGLKVRQGQYCGGSRLQIFQGTSASS